MSTVTEYSYDDNGNTLTSTRIEGQTIAEQTIYDWDYENRLIQADTETANAITQSTYQYNANGIRVAATTDGQETRYLIDTNQPYAQVIEEYSPNGDVLAYYTYGNDLISQVRVGQQSFYHVDGLGSTRALTDSSGNVSDTYTYDAYGELIASTGDTENNYLYTGEQYDSNLGEYYLRARYYDPSVGRFTASDPFEGVFTEPLSLAKYPYVHGNPVNATDPTGLFLLSGYFNTQNELQKLNAAYTQAFLSTIGSRVAQAGGIIGSTILARASSIGTKMYAND
ncbi:MAG: RHS repeat-associated core domain-containing protein [Rivularia sp. (in: cyanobacteria)]